MVHCSQTGSNCSSALRRLQVASIDSSLTHPDLAIYREWLHSSLQSYPDKEVAKNVDLVVDGYDVVDKQVYPSWKSLLAEAEDGYSVVMLTGSRES
jgi:hypothetical protein